MPALGAMLRLLESKLLANLVSMPCRPLHQLRHVQLGQDEANKGFDWKEKWHRLGPYQ